MSSGGGDSRVEYTQSPEQRQLLQSIMPMVQGLAQYGTDMYFGGSPMMGAPSMRGGWGLNMPPPAAPPVAGGGGYERQYITDPGALAQLGLEGPGWADVHVGPGGAARNPEPPARRTPNGPMSGWPGWRGGVSGGGLNVETDIAPGGGGFAFGNIGGSMPPGTNVDAAIANRLNAPSGQGVSTGQPSGQGVLTGRPTGQGVLTGQPMYDIPSPATAMPTSDWWNSLSPEVKGGLYEPYVEAGKGLMEAMGGGGQLGSARAGFSGAAGSAMGELAGQAARNVGLDAWRMTSPMAMAGWNAELQRNQLGYQQGQQERLGDYQTAMNVWNRPMSILSMLGMGMPQGMVQPGGGGGLGGMFSGGLMGGLGGGMLGLGLPGIIGGGILGGLGGLL